MSNLRSFCSLSAFFLLMGLGICPLLKAQAAYYKFPVMQEGIYKITQSQAQVLGASSVGEISVYGYGGMLPQLLDSNALDMKEIPVKEIDGDLYFFLAAANTLEMAGGTLQYQAHHYTDTLYYLVQARRPPVAAIPTVTLPPVSEPGIAWLYQAITYKKEEHNVLSSGRNWYGERLFDGETITFNFPEVQKNSLPLYFQGKFMARSLTESNVQVSINEILNENTSLPPISNNRYGIKGTEASLIGYTEGKSHYDNLQVKFHYQTADRNGSGYLDCFILGMPFYADSLPSGIFYNFADKASALKADGQQFIWDISDFFGVKDISHTEPVHSEAQKVAVFKPDEAAEIPAFQEVDIQLREQAGLSELLIITAPSLKAEAVRLADHKNKTGIGTQVVLVQDIYDSFGYGNPDISAIRNLLAYHYHRGGKLKHVLFFGKGTFDYKGILGGRPNLVPTYSSRNSLNPLTTYSSDDYFGFMQMGEGDWNESMEGDIKLSIGVGRLPVINAQEARHVVDKIIAYGSLDPKPGDWKRKVLFVADDGDNNIHLNDSEALARHLSEHHPEIILEKLYLDAYEQTAGDAVQRSPGAKLQWEALLDSSFLLVNYIGHGSETTLMAEELFTVSDLNNWPENSRLPIFMTATCEFGRHDSPLIRSGAEELLVARKKGAIALLSTGRPVFSNINFSLNKAFIENVFTPTEGQPKTLGEIFKLTKNNSLNGPLNRNFSLLGDPSLPLPLPKLTVQHERYMDVGLQTATDTLKGLQQIHYTASIEDPLTGAAVNSFNGTYEILLADRPMVKTTLGDESNAVHYDDGQVYLFRGKGRVTNGQLEGELLFPLPPDRVAAAGTVRIWAKDEATMEEAFGASKIILDGSGPPPITDRAGPSIYISGQENGRPLVDIPFSTIQMQAILEDPSGIHISPSNPRHAISLQVNHGQKINLNAYYQALHGSYSQGILEFPVTGLEEGVNFLTLEVWDNVGNVSSKTIKIAVKGSSRVKILSHVIYPNPATSFSEFRLSHNRPGENLALEVRIFSLEGREIFSLSRRFPKAKSLLENISWVFLQTKTKYPAKGTYLYVLELKSEKDGSTDGKSGKIIIQ